MTSTSLDAVVVIRERVSRWLVTVDGERHVEMFEMVPF